jgi:predicted ATPase
MITRLSLTNFKSFADADHEVRIGPLTLIVGTNASGKSNIRDALRFLHGIARGYTLPEILGEKYAEGGVLQWKGIRGGIREVAHGVKGGEFELEVRTSVIQKVRVVVGEKRVALRERKWQFRYRIQVLANPGRNTSRIQNEELIVGGTPAFSTYKQHLKAEQLEDGKQILVRYRNPSAKKYIGPTIRLHRDQPLVSQLAEHPDVTATVRTASRVFMNNLASMRFLDLDPQSLRRPSLPGQVVLGDKGENLSSVLQSLCEDPQKKRRWLIGLAN